MMFQKKSFYSSAVGILVTICAHNALAQGTAGGVSLPSNPEFPTAEYPYAQRPDGCSGWQSPSQVRDTWGPVSFKDACNAHDRCYYTLGSSWQQCNTSFGQNLRSACTKDLRGYPNALMRTCYFIADSCVAGVNLGVAASVFDEAQEKQHRYEGWVSDYLIPITFNS